MDIRYYDYGIRLYIQGFTDKDGRKSRYHITKKFQQLHIGHSIAPSFSKTRTLTSKHPPVRSLGIPSSFFPRMRPSASVSDEEMDSKKPNLQSPTITLENRIIDFGIVMNEVIWSDRAVQCVFQCFISQQSLLHDLRRFGKCISISLSSNSPSERFHT